MKQYDPSQIEPKWRAKWEEEQVYRTVESGDKPKFYVLDMFPYPSGEGLHVGHPKGFIATDVIARKKMLEGYDVLHPMGWDAFGLPAENYAIANKVHPKIATAKNVQRYKKQLENIGFTYDWNREIDTTDPGYYRWTQWVFLKLYGHSYDDALGKAIPIEQLPIPDGMTAQERRAYIDDHRLAYVDYKPINWCPSCKTGLAGEDLEDGRCERCKSEIERRPMRQWVLRITKYAQRMLDNLDRLDWEPSIIEMQKNWIGRSQGTQFKMPIDGSDDFFEVFTTRIDTVFGMTFAVLAPDHPLVESFKGRAENSAEIEAYVAETKKKTDMQRTDLNKQKTGVQIRGIHAINPFNGRRVALFIGDYVLANYGTGAIMAVPAHDERDYEFAKNEDLEIIESVSGGDISQGAYTQYGTLVDSGPFTGLPSIDAIPKMQTWLEANGLGFAKIQYRIQEWVFSRQRYWGEPIPMIHCPTCGTVPLKESDLPLLLPDVEAYEPTGTEEGPLSNISEWMNVPCPLCGGGAKRESNTMPQWAGSSWYWNRYKDPTNDQALVSQEKERYWKSVDLYVGGAEHATRHLIYARFWHAFLYDIGVVSTPEPFDKLQHVGLILADDGRKMSKRWHNVINPDDIVSEFGADSLRLYEMFMGPFAQEIAWNTNGVKGVRRFLDKVYALSRKADQNSPDAPSVTTLLNKTIKKVGEDIDHFKFNTAVASMMTLVNAWSDQERINAESFRRFILLLSPFCPHIAEEIWQDLQGDGSLFKASWPQYDPDNITDATVNIAIQVNGKLRDAIDVEMDTPEETIREIALARPQIQKYLAGAEVRKIVYVKNKILSIVV